MVSKNVEEKLKKWQEARSDVDIVDKYNRLTKVIKKKHPEYKTREVNDLALDLIRTRYFRGKIAPGGKRKAISFTGVKIGDSFVIDRLEITRRIRRMTYNKDKDRAIGQGLCFEDGTPRDTFETVRKYGKVVANPNFGKSLENRHDYWRRLFFVIEYEGIKKFAYMDSWGELTKTLDCPFGMTLTFPALLIEEANPIRLRASTTTKFIPAVSEWDYTMEELIVKYAPDIIEFNKLRETHEVTKKNKYRYVWTKGKLKWNPRYNLPDPDTGKMRHWLIPLDADVTETGQDSAMLTISPQLMNDIAGGSSVYVLGKTNVWRPREEQEVGTLEIEVYALHPFIKVTKQESVEYDAILEDRPTVL